MYQMNEKKKEKMWGFTSCHVHDIFDFLIDLIE